MSANRFHFRAWYQPSVLGDAGEMHYWSWESFSHGRPDSSGSNLAYAEAIMQSTGLLDKNGKEIFEGDILGKSLKDKLPVQVIYVDKFACYDLAYLPINEHAESLYYKVAEKYRVIGNIYENPELLKVKK